jgi:hypothetical protein
MKKLLLTVTLCLACAAAFAQGKVRLVNDSLHLVYWNPNAALLAAGDSSLAGLGYTLAQGNQTLRIELWSGTASTALTLAATTDFAGQAGAIGTWGGMNVTLGTAAGPTFFNIEIYDAAAGSYDVASTTAGHYFGSSGIFTTVSSSTIAYNSLVNHNAPANSTWANGTWNLDNLSAGFRGSISLQQVPEPTTIALAGLGAAALMIFRRRK